jgi:hypothetical protein
MLNRICEQDKLNEGSLTLERVTRWIMLGFDEAVDTHKIATLEGLAEGHAEDFVKVHSTAMLGLVLAEPPAAGSQSQQTTTATVAASGSASAVTTRSRRAVTKGLEPIAEAEADAEAEPPQRQPQPKSAATTTTTFSGMLSGGDTCPETLLLDLHRLRSMRQEFEHISLVVALLITASHNMQVVSPYNLGLRLSILIMGLCEQNVPQKKRKTQLGPTGSVIGGAIDEAVLEKICDLALGASTSMERMAASTSGPAGRVSSEETALMERLINEDIRTVLAEESTLSEEMQGDMLRALRKCSEPGDHVRALM